MVIAFAVIILSEFGQRTFQRAFAEQDQPGQAFLLYGAYPTFGERIGMSLQMRPMAILRPDVSE